MVGPKSSIATRSEMKVPKKPLASWIRLVAMISVPICAHINLSSLLRRASNDNGLSSNNLGKIDPRRRREMSSWRGNCKPRETAALPQERRAFEPSAIYGVRPSDRAVNSGNSAMSFASTPLVQPNPSCNSYSPPPPPPLPRCSGPCATSYFSTSTPVWSNPVYSCAASDRQFRRRGRAHHFCLSPRSQGTVEAPNRWAGPIAGRSQ